jgi:diaminohydroxyphosphoribosylaminopyrimidine deaminase / 5-amino-6-(5-phosphoribosylamino)uracil reductase
MTLARAVELARAARERAYPKPTVGAVVEVAGEVVGEGATEAGGRHAEVVALDAAGERARGGTMFVTLPCADRVIEAGVARVVIGARDPNPEAAGGIERLQAAGVEVELTDSFEARRLHEVFRTSTRLARPFVTYKVAMTLDGRIEVLGERWVSGVESRRLVHELRAQVDAVVVGAGTARADRPRLDAREVETPRGQPRRIVFSRNPLPEGLDLEVHSGPLVDELRSLAAEGVQSLLLEGGPTLAAAFLAEGLVDKVLVFVAPTLVGEGRSPVAPLLSALALTHLTATQVGDDVLLEAYVHEP